jgi:hypothetical protein
MVLYEFTCPEHGVFEQRLSMDDPSLDASLCPICGDWSRRHYTPPITDCKSYGKSFYGARTPQWKWKPQSEDQARQFRDIARREGARTQFGAGRTSGT